MNALAQANREAETLLAALGRPRPTTPQPQPRRRDWSTHDSRVPFKEPGGTFKRQALGHRAGYVTESGAQMRRISWAEFRRVCGTLANDNEPQKRAA